MEYAQTLIIISFHCQAYQRSRVDNDIIMSSFQYFIQFRLIQAITYRKHNYNRPLVCASLLICIIHAYLRC